MSREKKSSIVMLRISPTLERRLEGAVKKSGIARQEIIRAGLDDEIKRIMADAPGVTPDEAKLIVECKRQGKAHGFDWKKTLAHGLIEFANRTPQPPNDPANVSAG
jgi:hypothetical protein